ncbi:MAG TPA: hypothetical protein VIL74_04550 [Pyrinomonadaceae bacterium]|jgi:hypothetical protein
MLKIKLFAVFALIACASCVFLFSSGGSRAQTGKTSLNRDAVLEKIGGYKKWKQVQKPEKEPNGEPPATDVLAISDSTSAG